MATGTDLYVIELIDNVSGRARVAQLAVSRMGAGLEKAGKQGLAAQLGLNAVSHALGNLAARGISAAIAGIGSLGRSLVETIDLASRSRAALSNLYGGVAEGKAVQQTAIRLSNRYGLELQTVLDTMAQFKGAGFSTAAAEELVKLGADMQALSTGGKDSAMQLESVFRALRKIKSQSFLQGDELNMLSEAGVSVDKIYGILQYRLGKTREEIMKMQGARQLPSNLVISAVYEATLKGRAQTAGELGEKFADSTTVGLKNRIGANITNAFFEAAQAAEPSLVKGLQSILGGVLGAGADGKGLQDALTKALEKVGAGLEDLGPKIPGFIASLEKVAAVLLDISKAVMPLLEALGSVGGFASKVLGFLPGKVAFELSDAAADAEARRKRRQTDAEELDIMGRSATDAAAISPLNDLEFYAQGAAEKNRGDAIARRALIAPSSEIRNQVIEGAAAVSAAGGGKKVDVGAVNVTVNLSNSGDPAEAVVPMQQWFDSNFGATLERQLEGTGD